MTWPDPALLDNEALGRMPRESAALIPGSPVPVLVPSADDLLGRGVVVVREHWYAFSARAPDLTLSVSATRIAHSVPGIPAIRGKDSIRGTTGFVTQNERIWSATWMENGVSYTLEVECDAEADPRCSGESYLLLASSQLVYVGGSGAGGAP